MSASISELFEKISLDKPVSYKNMAIIPVLLLNGEELEYISLRDALGKSNIHITEVSESGSVPELKVANKGNDKILLLDGEELIGAKQNRVLNMSVLLKENSEVVINVSCVEQGRWNYHSKKFVDSDFLMEMEARRNKLESISQSLKMSDKYISNQGRVWQDVRNLAFKAKVRSSTMAMNEVFEARRASVGEYVREFVPLNYQRGMIIAIDGKIEGFEYISNPKVYQEVHQKILHSYAIGAALSEKHDDNNDVFELGRNFLEQLSKVEVNEYKSPGIGKDLRFETKSIIGAALSYHDKIIHMVAHTKN